MFAKQMSKQRNKRVVNDWNWNTHLIGLNNLDFPYQNPGEKNVYLSSLLLIINQITKGQFKTQENYCKS